MAKYIPGVCNIGKNEIRKRYALGLAGFVLAAVVSYCIFSLAIPKWTLVFAFVLLVMGFEGFYQGYFHFCAGFAAAGIYDFAGSGGSRKKVPNSESHRNDMMKAYGIHLYSVVSAIVVLVFIYL